jgi:hypothetical protein
MFEVEKEITKGEFLDIRRIVVAEGEKTSEANVNVVGMLETLT